MKRLLTSLLLLLLRPEAGPAAPEPRLDLSALQQAFGWTSRTVRTDSIELGNTTNRARFYPGYRRIELDGYAAWLNSPCLPAPSNDATIARVDLDTLLVPALMPTNGLLAGMRVMLDPGHGGEDSGARTPDGALSEKTFTLDLARRIGARLERAGMTVGYTRDTDVFRSLSERTATAATWRAQVFLSLHANYAQNHDATGRETYVLPVAGYSSTATERRVQTRPCTGNSNDVLNALLGLSVHRLLPGRTRSGDRGLRRARYQVLRDAPCPAVLVECGFLSNSRDAALLASGWYRDRLSRAVTEGVLDYSRRLPDWAFTHDPPLAVALASLPPDPESPPTQEAPDATSALAVAAADDADAREDAAPPPDTADDAPPAAPEEVDPADDAAPPAAAATSPVQPPAIPPPAVTNLPVAPPRRTSRTTPKNRALTRRPSLG